MRAGTGLVAHNPATMPLPRRDFITLASLAALGGAAGPPRMAAAQDLHAIQVLAVPTDGVKSLLWAQKMNLFRKHGVQVNVVPMNSGAAIFAALVGGSADIGSGSLFPVFAAYSRGVPLRIVAPGSLYLSSHPDTLLLVQKDGPIHAARDLNGKTMAVDSLQDAFATASRVWIDQHGGDGKSLKMIELKSSEQLDSVETGRVDAVVLKPPFLTTALDDGKVRVLGKPLDAIGPRFLLSGWVASVDFISKNPAAVSGFAAAMAEASRYTNAHQAATTDIVAAFTGQDASLIGRGVRSTAAETLNLSDIQVPLDFAYKYGVLSQHFDASALLAHP